MKKEFMYCDRCKRQISSKIKPNKNLLRKLHLVFLLSWFFDDDFRRQFAEETQQINNPDLCKDCIRSFSKWFKGGKQWKSTKQSRH